MRRGGIATMILATALAYGCKSETKGEAEGEAKAEMSAEADVSAKARIGGKVITAGDYNVEVLLHPSGLVLALVMDAEGNLVAKPADLKLRIVAQGEGSARQKVELHYNTSVGRFVGHAGAALAAGPVGVSLVVNGKAHAGRAAHVALSAEASHGGQIIVVGDYSVELVANGDLVTAFVFDASGKAHASGDLDLELTIDGKPVRFEWDAPSASYKAKLDAGISLEGKPLQLSVAADGKAAIGAVHAFKTGIEANLDARTKLAANLKAGLTANAKAELEAKVPNVKAELKAAQKAAATAKASVKVPKPNLKVDVKKKASASTSGGKAKAGVSFGFGSK